MTTYIQKLFASDRRRVQDVARRARRRRAIVAIEGLEQREVLSHGFGLLGLFLGPVLLSVTFALMADFPPRQPAVEAVPVAPPLRSAGAIEVAPRTESGSAPAERMSDPSV